MQSQRSNNESRPQLVAIMHHPRRTELFRLLEEICGAGSTHIMLNMISKSIDVDNNDDHANDDNNVDVLGRSVKTFNERALRILRDHYPTNSHPKGLELLSLVKQVLAVTSDQTEAEIVPHVANYFRQRRFKERKKQRRQQQKEDEEEELDDDLVPGQADASDGPSGTRLLSTTVSKQKT